MSFDRLTFSKDWTDPTDFPTVETSETQVRADMQLLHNESRDALNALMTALERGNQDALVRHGSDSAAYIRRTSEGVLETSSDGETWYPIAWGDTVKNHAAQHAANGTDPVTPAAIGAAGAVHASDHAAGGSDPVTPQAIGALPLTGGTLTGNLAVEKSSYPTVSTKNTTTARNASVVAADSGDVFIYNQKDGNNRQIVMIGTESNPLASAIRLQRNVGGKITHYNIYGEHNKPTPSDIGIVSGTYTGNAGDAYDTLYEQTIDLGFTPKAVLVWNVNGFKLGTSGSSTTDLLLALAGVDVMDNFSNNNTAILKVVNNGFCVANINHTGFQSTTIYYSAANTNAWVYRFIAFG